MTEKNVPMLNGVAIVSESSRNHEALAELVSGPGLDRLCSLAAEVRSGSDALAAIRRGLTDEELLVRRYSMHALCDAAASDLNAREAGEFVPLLTSLLDDRDPDMQRLAIVVLGDLGPTAEPAIVPLADAARRPVLQDAACEALASIGSASVPALIGMLQEGGRRVRPACAALASIGSAARDAVPLLLQTLATGSPAKRAAAGRALGWIRASPDRVVPALLEALQAPRNRGRKGAVVRRAACAALGGSSFDKLTAAALQQALADPNAEVRQAAAQALERFGVRPRE